MNKKLIINIKGGYMNKKITFSILLILLITTLCLGAISAADSNGVKFKSDDGFKLNIPKNEDYTIYKVENINFKIPLSLINNTYIINSSNDYISINNFSSLSDVDIWPTDNDILSYEYGETASGSQLGRRKIYCAGEFLGTGTARRLESGLAMGETSSARTDRRGQGRLLHYPV